MGVNYSKLRLLLNYEQLNYFDDKKCSKSIIYGFSLISWWFDDWP